MLAGCDPVVSPCLNVHGACVLFDASFPPDSRRYLCSRIDAAWERGAVYWGADPDSLRGWTVVMHGYSPLLFGQSLWGLTTEAARRVDVALERPTCPEFVLVHELGHAFSVAAGGEGRPHGDDEDPLLDDAAILGALDGVPGCESKQAHRWVAIER
jgi:hypothetical protein